MATLAGCGEAQDPAQPLDYAKGAIEVVEVIRRLPFTLNDPLGIVRAADLIATRDGYAIADAGGHVLLLNADLELEHRYGQEGSGPRELRLPFDLEPLPDGGVAIYDSGNNRIVLIDREGRFSGTRPARIPPSDFAVLPDGSIVVKHLDGDAGLAFYAPRERGLFGHVPDDLQWAVTERSLSRIFGGHLVAGDDGMVHHYDDGTKRIYSYGVGGELVAVRRFSDRTMATLAELREEAEKTWGRDRVVSISSVLGLNRVGPYPLLETPGLPGAPGIGLLLDPRGGPATPVVAGGALSPEDLRGTGRFVLRGDTLTAATQSGLVQYRVRYPAHLAHLSSLRP